MEQLQRLRLLQVTLRPVFEHELAEQSKHDTEVQRLMDTDPQGHIEMMRVPQEHKALIRELPTQLLREEAKLYEEDRSRVGGGPGEKPARARRRDGGAYPDGALDSGGRSCLWARGWSPALPPSATGARR